MREEEESWIVGRRDGEDFVEVPSEAVAFIRALQGRCTVGEAAQRVYDSYGHHIDAEEFADTLIELRFAGVDDGDTTPAKVSAPSLQWIKQRWIRWLFSTPAYAGVACLLVAGTVAAAARGEVVPSYHAYFLSSSPTVNVLWNTAVVLMCLAVHEALHLMAARADGVHARIGFGTRLQFLAAQTSVSGLWGAARRTRFRVYLAGMVGDLSIAAACSVSLDCVGGGGLAHRVLQALLLSRMMAVAYEFCLFMKTDMYFVVQELLHCKNLYLDGWDYIRYIGRLLAVALGARERAGGDPTLELPPQERRAVKLYAGFTLMGSTLCLGLFAFYALPLTVTLYVSSAERLMAGLHSGSPAEVADGLTVLCVESVFQGIFVKVFIEKHGKRFAALGKSIGRYLTVKNVDV